MRKVKRRAMRTAAQVSGTTACDLRVEAADFHFVCIVNRLDVSQLTPRKANNIGYTFYKPATQGNVREVPAFLERFSVERYSPTLTAIHSAKPAARQQPTASTPDNTKYRIKRLCDDVVIGAIHL